MGLASCDVVQYCHELIQLILFLLDAWMHGEVSASARAPQSRLEFPFPILQGHCLLARLPRFRAPDCRHTDPRNVAMGRFSLDFAPFSIPPLVAATTGLLYPAVRLAVIPPYLISSDSTYLKITRL